jgi:putative nucleotidyltransferase with HDIG domain
MFDFIKRAQLQRQGLSCGKFRRKHLQGETWELIQMHPLAGVVAFAIAFVAIDILLNTLADGLQGQAAGFSTVFVFASFVTATLHWYLGFPAGSRSNSLILLTFTAIMIQLAVVGLTLHYGQSHEWGASYALFVLPHALSPMLLCMLAGRRIGLYSAVYGTLLGASLVQDSQTLPFMATGLSVGFMAVFASQRVRRRSRLLSAGLYIGLVATAMMIVFGQAGVSATGGGQLLMLAAPLIVGVVTAMLTGAVLPVFEQLFHVTTDISWLELGDLNHPLMRRLSIEAPGTYHHSLVVANLSEAAAEAIGANATLCRVASYFHDIGKLTKPEYFIENMNPEDNPHDDLTARMSSLVIMAHVKDGVDMAIKHRLNTRIIDVIEQHHGTSLVWFFYRRALDQKKEIIRLVEQEKAREDDVPDVTEDGFRYPGPKPEFKESAIISLADSVESASRTLVKPNSARVEQLVEDIVRNRILDHQLDECDLTLAELALVKASFVKTLLSMMHSRIKYPKEPVDQSRTEEPRKPVRDLEQVGQQAAKVSSAA